MSFYTNDLFKKHSEASLRQHKIKKRVYTYDHMNDQKWDKFITAIDERHTRWKLSSMNIQSTSDLNRYWALIKNAIMNAAFHTIDNHLTTSQQKKQQSTPQMDDALSHVKYLNKILKLFTLANLPTQLPILQS